MDPNLKKTCLELSELIDYLQLPESEWPLEEITREEAKVRIANFLGLDPKDPQLLERAREKINKILAGELEVESVPKNLDELVKEYEEHLEELAKQRETFLKRTYPTLSEQIRNALQTKYANDLLEQLKESEKQLPEEERILTQNPRRAKEVSRQMADLFAPNLPQTARIEAFSEEEYREVLKKAQPKIKQILERVGVTQPEKTIQIFIDQAAKKDLPLAQEVAATPRSFTKEAPPPRKKISPEDLVLPKKVADRLAEEPESVAFAPVYTALQPQAAAALAQKKVIFAPMVMVFRAASEPTPEWREMIEKGIFFEDIEATIKRYKEAGLPEDHPIIQSLEDKKTRFLEQQKREIIKDGKVIYKDKLAAKILRRYYLHAKQIGGLEPIDKETGFPLQSSPAPLWSKREGYSWQLRQFLDATGSATRLYETVDVIPGRKVIRFTLPSKIVRKITFGRFESFGAIRTTVYQKTLGRAVSYVGRKLAETAIGKAVKEGFKKAATWLATRAGVQTAVTAAGVAAAPETAGVSLLVAAAINLAIEAGGKILGKIWDTIKSIIRDPGKALALITGGIALAVLLPAPFVIIAVFPIVLGALGLVSWGAASAGAIAGGFAANVVAFFTAVATLPITAPIALFIVGIISTIAAITFFIVMTTAGAFILPVGPTEIIPEVPPPPAPPVVPPPPGLTFRWPIDAPEFCSSNFGYRPKPNAPIPCCQYHTGIDIVDPGLPNSCGVWVYATAKGVVTKVGNTGFTGYGKYIIIKHNGFYSLYAHLEAWSIHEGDEVDQTTAIGRIGST
ncbi:peptidoglycan DD-metalloendopeptidase family protein, partial [Patescibacteria group bacterium]|nr:peptidoglycan DD-metalloendopeptidase family protein [Patescibacteria group bacterium]